MRGAADLRGTAVPFPSGQPPVLGNCTPPKLVLEDVWEVGGGKSWWGLLGHVLCLIVPFHVVMVSGNIPVGNCPSTLILGFSVGGKVEYDT